MIYPKKTAITNSSGFTLFELFIIICIVGIVFTIGIPSFSAWIPDYRLRSKAKELYADMHLAKIKALKENDKYKIVFSTDVANSYNLVKSDDVIEKTVTFSSSKSDNKILFGGGSATKNATKSGGILPSDGISYTGNTLTFNPRGTGSSGYVYLQNRKGTSYAIGTLPSGVILIKKWTGSDWK
jgi:Tfp pilus assembly protein FimT